jgi:hypothetical protein
MKETRSRKKSSRQADAIGTRASRNSQIYNLTLDIHNLRQELYDLELRRAMLHTRSFYSRADSPMSILRVVGRYFHGFANGYRGPCRQPEQHAFVASIANEDLSLGVTGLGVDSLLNQWLLYTDLFHVRRVALLSTEILTTSESGSLSSGTMVKCATEFRGVLTPRGVDTVFPHANHDPALMLRALGRPIRIRLLFHLYFNDTGRLVRHDVEADFLAALQEVLDGDPTAAARFIDGARLGQESMIVIEPVAGSALNAKSSGASIGNMTDGTGSGSWGGLNCTVEVEMVDANFSAEMVAPPSPALEDAVEVVHHVDGEEISQVGDEPSLPSDRHSLRFLLSPV